MQHCRVKSKTVPWVKQEIVETRFYDALPPLSVLIWLIKLLAQSLFFSLALGQLEGLQSPTQFWTVTRICRNAKETRENDNVSVLKSQIIYKIRFLFNFH